MNSPPLADCTSPEEAACLLDQLAQWLRSQDSAKPGAGVVAQREPKPESTGDRRLSAEWAAMLESAEAEYSNRRARDRILPKEWVGEPGWDILLQLFICRLRKTKSSVTNICMASQGSLSTALRYIRGFEDSGFIVRSHSPSDQRVNYLELSDVGFDTMQRIMRRRNPAPVSHPHERSLIIPSSE